MSTKEKILEAALALFSKRGYTAVSVRDIAAKVGVRESAMYKHFSDKRAVFDRLVADYIALSDDFMADINALPTQDPESLKQTAEIYSKLTDEEFLKIGGRVFTAFLLRPDVIQFWRMISIERFNDKKLAKLWHRLLFEEPIEFQTGMFGLLVNIGAVRPAEPTILALEFFAPLLLLYLQALPFEPGSKEFKRSLEFANLHMKHFRETYTIKSQEK